jgi:hypothetical protein
MAKLEQWMMDAFNKQLLCWFWDTNKTIGVKGCLKAYNVSPTDYSFRCENNIWYKNVELYEQHNKIVVPWTKETCPLKFGSELLTKNDKSHMFVIAYDFEYTLLNVMLGNSWYSFSEILDYYTMPDGSPCGFISNEARV